jgi:hypothetical protein
MIGRFLVTNAVLILSVMGTQPIAAQQSPSGTWHFVVSGDSRNCGDVVMPGIAETAKKNRAVFYWHLGDLRHISMPDEDIQHQPEHLGKPLSIKDYEAIAWPDFIDSQIGPFGSIPFLVGIGNHETIPLLKTREDFLLQFADWLETPMLRTQRLRDDPRNHGLKAYYHWIDRGVAFYFLDNATPDQFDANQMDWFERVLDKDLADATVKTIVAGMHKALPDSIAAEHGMSGSISTDSGRRVYADLLRAQNAAHKHVYILSSHSHFYMDGIFDTDYWKQHGGVLPGWIVGTAGAQRYALPPHSSDAHAALTNVYGSLLGTVQPSGEVRFEFEKLSETDIPAAVKSRYGQEFVHWCFVENTQAK